MFFKNKRSVTWLWHTSNTSLEWRWEKNPQFPCTATSRACWSSQKSRIFPRHDFQTPKLFMFPAITNITLALFDDSGWYITDPSKAAVLPFGRGRGCDFLHQNCTDPRKKYFSIRSPTFLSLASQHMVHTRAPSHMVGGFRNHNFVYFNRDTMLDLCLRIWYPKNDHCIFLA